MWAVAPAGPSTRIVASGSTTIRVSEVTCRFASGPSLARHDTDGRRACPRADHRGEVRAARVLRPVGVVDPLVEGPVHRLEGDLLRDAGRGDPSGFLSKRSLVPARVAPVVGADVEAVVD